MTDTTTTHQLQGPTWQPRHRTYQATCTCGRWSAYAPAGTEHTLTACHHLHTTNTATGDTTE